ncbi:type III-B CRISPR module RAMP protein Cmr6 [Leptolyngbya sp. PL-A3]|uniref:type III-B CRISPR module RAMP protein Cmr6 n=1 Tax=Leptolyngbya sp. PL-A3 TaxID=2933911 RepID=UPI003297797D
MVFDRPKRPGKPQPNPATSRPNPTTEGSNPKPEKKVITIRAGSGNGGSRPSGGGGGNGGNSNPPSPWLIDPGFQPDPSASFVEYLRWMRSPDSDHKDPTKVQILQMAEEQGNYRDRLLQLTERTKQIAGEGNTFQVKCLWRIRVGGHRGPESILLPAFDALGMPYIPASTLRGVARTQAIRELMEQEKLSWKQAEERVSRQYFGFLDSTKSEERSGKVVFLDAYPLPQKSSNNGGLAVDMANNIWSWDASRSDLNYSPNPSPFLSLADVVFLIGIRRTRTCDDATLDQVKQWLIEGLQAGIGSQVNTGYGSLVRAGASSSEDTFFSVEFTLQGQLIHGRQRFTQWNWNSGRNVWQTRGIPDAEVRPVAFKSMMRYWFRVFARGVLPSREVQRLEGNLFGSISPTQERGWLTVRIADGQVVQQEARPTAQGKDDPCGEQAGKLLLSYSSEAFSAQKQHIEALCANLTWMMFHLGGLGQGARRPCYSRSTRERAPWWRGSTLIPETDDAFWKLPNNVQGFQERFRQRLNAFYEALGHLADRPISPQRPLEVGQVRSDRWPEAVDTNCRILVCRGEEDFGKPYALAVLHHRDLKRGQNYDANLCGQVHGGVKPSPVWIADLEEYQVVTVFGATQNPRKQYVDELRQRTDRNNFAQIWPLQ